ncbi:uncharacterized protein BDZ99DRAFT_572674 [Mytilinidion resinicola]|uniref:Uncharacterized protein n=1 Tax=Mytilinidion resinicola TaxID=574789 RepID=A0A6A6YIF3_9PEZI|nr:uncharacterized protein BDZ99DRAFT_572674 [Mytilinidion resinicola]KAF2807774.1 hypothetical protein BDZ99DRAFT_572674 [Mytilinidion resinicola]
MFTVQPAITKYHTSLYNFHLADLRDLTDSHLAAINEAEAMAIPQSNNPTPPLTEQFTELNTSLTSLTAGIDSFFEGLPAIHAVDSRPYPDPNRHFKAYVRTTLTTLKPYLDVHRGVMRALASTLRDCEQSRGSEISRQQVDDLEKLVKEMGEVASVMHRTFGYPTVSRSKGMVVESLKGVQQSVKREQELVKVLLEEGNVKD